MMAPVPRVCAVGEMRSEKVAHRVKNTSGPDISKQLFIKAFYTYLNLYVMFAC